MKVGYGQDRDTARDIALAAGEILLREKGRLRSIDYKSATDMVTDLDRSVEERICADLLRSFPGDGFLAEEGSRHESATGRDWVVDPLDGTTNYVHGHPFFAVSIGCRDAQGMCIGVVYAPELDELFLAVRGGGARLERPLRGGGRDLERREPVELERALLATGFPYVRDEIVSLNCALVETFLLRKCHGVRRGGSAAVDLCHVAAGILDGYWEMELKPWDVAAGSLIAAEAGAVVTDFRGAAGPFDGSSVLAAAPGLQQRMLAIIAETKAEREA